ncbi:1,4-alpha-glucan branching protein GlgB [Zavarzinella formosa]|uniref:1,4-alpha-glucan branching protein GlgB n=1 Tax=Zavarzinella formosa TaxID=360055 RepID=UPI00030250FF|nr:1,4-alpha-glucan branching protein GlgB [Zavarzinella formosa]
MKNALSQSLLEDKARLGEQDAYLFNEGSHYRLFDKLGAHYCSRDGVLGTQFAVWAPAAEQVTVFGDFNGWDKSVTPLAAQGSSGIWMAFVPGILPGTVYKYHLLCPGGYRVDKADPFAFYSEEPPKTASVVANLGEYQWEDGEWMANRYRFNGIRHPISIYEVHLGSWMRDLDGNFLTYRELAHKLADHMRLTGFTHVELMPITEHPFYGSWGYQSTGFFSPTSRYGTPQDLMYFVDYLHQRGIGVILDWVPSHFPSDEHGLMYFDGTHLFEHADPRQGFHPDWGSAIFNYGRHEVRSFLLSSALFWLEKYHIDGLRVDAVASMLYLDYSRKAGEWIPNIYGGNENLEAVDFIRRFNETVYREFPDVQTIAEESTAWSSVSRPTDVGGLGFGMKWDMGWMHDTLKYMARDPIYRGHHHGELTFRMVYAFSENFVLPLSHDEVVHGKGSMVEKMPGDDWQKFANLRLLYGYMFGQPGKKLLFQGCEWGQWREWQHDTSLDWHQRQFPPHAGMERWITDLNTTYRAEPALHNGDCRAGGFEWVDCDDAPSSTLSFLRIGDDGRFILVICNFTPVPRENYRVGVPHGDFWRELLNSDATVYWGSGIGNAGGVLAEAEPWHGRPYSLTLTIPPLGVLFFKGT